MRQERRGEGPIKVMVRIDEAGQNDVTFEVEHFIGGLRQFLLRADLFDEAVAHEKTTLGNFPRVSGRPS